VLPSSTVRVPVDAIKKSGVGEGFWGREEVEDWARRVREAKS
jgi:hypothetical protein